LAALLETQTSGISTDPAELTDRKENYQHRPTAHRDPTSDSFSSFGRTGELASPADGFLLNFDFKVAAAVAQQRGVLPLTQAVPTSLAAGMTIVSFPTSISSVFASVHN